MPPYNDNQSIPGELFKLLRSLKGIKQGEAARKLAVSQQAISKLEKCKTIKSLQFGKLVAAFKFSKEDIDTAKKFLPPPPGKMSKRQCRQTSTVCVNY